MYVGLEVCSEKRQTDRQRLDEGERERENDATEGIERGASATESKSERASYYSIFDYGESEIFAD